MRFQDGARGVAIMTGRLRLAGARLCLAASVVAAAACGDSGPPSSASEDSQLLQGGQFTFSVPLPPNVSMSDVALGSNSNILIGDRVTVGVEGAASERATVANAGTGTVSVSADARLTSDVWSRGNVVFVGERGQIAGSVTTAGTLTRQNNVVIGGPVLEHQTLSAVPTSWTITFPSSSTDVVLQPQQTRTLTPGAYATVSVASNATLTLQSGTYYFDQLTNEPQGKIQFTGAGPFVVYVKTTFFVKGPIILPAGANPASLLIGFAGTSDVFVQTDLDATVVAPRANVTLAQIGTGVYQGAFFGKGLTLQADVHMLRRSANIGTVMPIAECVIPQTDGSFRAVFGYLSSSTLGNITIATGDANHFDPAPITRGQPTVFLPGRQRAQFSVPFDGKPLVWFINGQSSTANAALPVCTTACVQHLVDPSRPRISTPLSTPARPISAADSTVIRDTFRWQDTLPVPETLSDGSPRIYSALVQVTSPESLKALDLLRIHHSATPIFEDEMTRLEQQGITQNFTFEHDGQGQFLYALIPGAIYNQIRLAALDPVEPIEIIRALQIREIPTTDTGFAPRASCGLAPTTQCVAQAANGSLRAVFRYNNPAGNPVTIPVGPDNNITGGPTGSLPIEAFAAGQHNAVFAVTIPTGATVRWTLNGQTVSANAATPRCTATVVAQIGVDSFNPFPAPATPSCRFATPQEAQFPTSRLPPASRVNTCTSVAYDYFGRLGFKWRDVESDADDADGLAADAIFAMTAPPGGTSTTTSALTSSQGDITVVRSALFGKLFRKVVQAVKGGVSTVVDGVRRGLRGVAGLFVGTRTIDVTIHPQMMDPIFASDEMRQAWGANYGRPISLAGLQLRAKRSVFLSVDHLDANNHGRVTILNLSSGARLCMALRNFAGFVTSGFEHDEICVGGLSTSQTTVDMPVTHSSLNIMAQITDGNLYMQRVGGFAPASAEIIIGPAARAVGAVNDGRPLSPCFSFSWANDTEQFMTALDLVASSAIGDYVENETRAKLRYVVDGLNKYIASLSTTVVQATDLVGQLTGTPDEPLAREALAGVNDALARARAALPTATTAVHAADDLVSAAAAAAKKGAGNDQVANAVAQKALDELSVNAVPVAVGAVQAAQDAAAVALAQVDALVAALQSHSSPAAAAAILLRGSLFSAQGTIQNAGAIIVAVVPHVANIAARGIVHLIVNSIGRVGGELFEIFLAGDMIVTAESTAVERGQVSHEYGHVITCNLMNAVNPFQFAAAYNEAAAQVLVFANKHLPADAAVWNESLAELFNSQVAGGTDYAIPNGATQGNRDNWCRSTNATCIEENVTNLRVVGTDGTAFNNFLLRNVTLFTEPFDDHLVFNGDHPSNGNPWRFRSGTSLLELTPAGTSQGQDADDDQVFFSNARGAYLLWMQRIFARGPLLREDNVLAGLNDVMTAHGDAWCARCQVFWNHTQETTAPFNNICPDRWVGTRPTVNVNGVTSPLACTFETCPAGTRARPDVSVCDPCPVGRHLDLTTYTCEPDIIVE